MEWKWRGRSPSYWVLLGLLVTLGVRGVAGGGQFLLVPSGDLIGVSTSVLGPTPFRDFLLPGLFLFFVLGIFPLIVAYAIFEGRQWARHGALAVGLVLTGWAIVEGVVLGFGERLQYLNLLQGVVVAILALSHRWSSIRSSPPNERS